MMSDIKKKEEAAMAARKAYTDHDGYSKTYKMGKKLDDLYAYRSRIMQDMEQEAEPEGGRIADQYGKQLNDLDSKISKLEDAINTIGDRERELEKRYQAAMDALKQARLAMKSAMQNESLDEANGTIAKGAYSFADYFGIPVSRLKGFKFDGTDDVEELHKVLGKASSNIKGTENIYRASITESADMLPSYEVIMGLATVLGALDLAQAARGGDSIIVDVAKALKAELGDKLEAAGAEAKRVVSKFKNDPKVKEIIMDAEEEVNESKRSTEMKIRRIEESVNEATETGLMVVPRTNADANKIQKWVNSSDMHGEWDAREGYFLFPEEEDGFDELEAELTKELDKLGVNYRIEGIFESKKSNQMSIKKFESYFSDDQLNEAASGDLIEKMDKALEDFEEALGALELHWGQLSVAADKIGKAMAGGDDSKEMRQAWYRASMAQRNAAKKAMGMLK
jgi:hypothetical protein